MEGSLEEVTLKLIPKNEHGLAKRVGAARQTRLCEAKRMSSVWVVSVHSFSPPTFTEYLLCTRNSSTAQEFTMSKCFVTRRTKLFCKVFFRAGGLVMRPPEVGRSQEVRAGRAFTPVLRAGFYHGTKGRHRRVLSRE